METMTDSRESNVLESWPGVVKNPHGGYHIHVILNTRESPVIGGAMNSQLLAPLGSPVLVGMSVFEDCVLFVLQDGHAVVVRVSDPAAAGSVVYFYHANGILWRAVPLEALNPGWVLSAYHFALNNYKVAMNFSEPSFSNLVLVSEHWRYQRSKNGRI